MYKRLGQFADEDEERLLKIVNASIDASDYPEFVVKCVPLNCGSVQRARLWFPHLTAN